MRSDVASYSRVSLHSPALALRVGVAEIERDEAIRMVLVMASGGVCRSLLQGEDVRENWLAWALVHTRKRTKD
jgi:hypothetical protein